MLAQEKLKELLDYNSKTGEFTWKVRVARRVRAGSIAGCLAKDGYMQIVIDGKAYKTHRLAWLYVYGYFPEHDIDHIDRIKHHNWISNLRHVSRSCNKRNMGNQKNNKSGIKGVYLHKQSKKWYAQIKINNKQIYLGLFKTKQGAAKARLKAEQEHGWENCDISSSAYQYVKNTTTKKIRRQDNGNRTRLR